MHPTGKTDGAPSQILRQSSPPPARPLRVMDPWATLRLGSVTQQRSALDVERQKTMPSVVLQSSRA